MISGAAGFALRCPPGDIRSPTAAVLPSATESGVRTAVIRAGIQDQADILGRYFP